MYHICTVGRAMDGRAIDPACLVTEYLLICIIVPINCKQCVCVLVQYVTTVIGVTL